MAERRGLSEEDIAFLTGTSQEFRSRRKQVALSGQRLVSGNPYLLDAVPPVRFEYVERVDRLIEIARDFFTSAERRLNEFRPETFDKFCWECATHYLCESHLGDWMRIIEMENISENELRAGLPQNMDRHLDGNWDRVVQLYHDYCSNPSWTVEVFLDNEKQ